MHTLNGSLTATAYDEEASHIQGARDELAPADGSKTSRRPPPALNEGRDTLRRSLAILFAALVSLLGAAGCGGGEEEAQETEQQAQEAEQRAQEAQQQAQEVTQVERRVEQLEQRLENVEQQQQQQRQLEQQVEERVPEKVEERVQEEVQERQP